MAYSSLLNIPCTRANRSADMCNRQVSGYDLVRRTDQLPVARIAGYLAAMEEVAANLIQHFHNLVKVVRILNLDGTLIPEICDFRACGLMHAAKR